MRTWFLFTPEKGKRINLTDPAQYTRYEVGKKSPPNRNYSSKIYAIKAECDCNGLPIIDAAIQQEMKAAVQMDCNSEHIIVRQEHFTTVR